jgi:hypothetical protein
VKRFSAAVAALVLTVSFAMRAPSARADVVIYSNLTNFSAQGYAGGGAATSGGDTITKTVADDITTAPGTAGNAVDGFTFTVANFNATAVTARAIVEFWASDGAGGGPGTLLTGFIFNPITFAGGSVVQGFSFVPETPLFTVPANGTFWAGITFDNNGGATGATAAQLNNLGQGIFAPPTVGSSQDAFFQSNAGGTIPGSNPAGGFFFFGGNPVADFGWQFLSPSPAAVPEPSPLILSSFAGLAVLGIGFLRNRLGSRSSARSRDN